MARLLRIPWLLMSWWETAYLHSPPWEIGAPQPEIFQIAENDEILGDKVLDLGCGPCDNAIFLAKKGLSITCFDISQLAIDKGKEKATIAGLKMRFIVGDALHLETFFSEGMFTTVIDSGFFHTLNDDDRPIFAKKICRVLAKEGRYFILCFSDKGEVGLYPRRVSKKEIIDTFSQMFYINYIKEAIIVRSMKAETGTLDVKVKAYLASLTKK